MHGVILCFDVTNEKSFNDAIHYWKNKLKQVLHKDTTFIFVGMKDDLENRQVSKQKAQEVAEENKMPYFEVSTKEGRLLSPFEELAEMLYLRSHSMTIINNNIGLVSKCPIKQAAPPSQSRVWLLCKGLYNYAKDAFFK